MTATVAVPCYVLSRARKHLHQTGRPWLCDPRPGEARIDALPGDSCYMLTLNLDDAERVGLLDLAEGDTPEDRAAHLMLLLADAAACALGGEPIRFECDGSTVGHVEVIDSPFGTRAVRVRGHVSLTCLSWLLREGRAGYYLGVVSSAACRELLRGTNG